MAEGTRSVAGPSWEDVGGFIRLVERTARVHLHISTTVVWDDRKRRERYTWVVEAAHASRTGRGAAVVRRWATYPSVGVRTVPALLYRLVAEVDAELEEHERARERQTAF